MLAALIDGMNEGGDIGRRRARPASSADGNGDRPARQPQWLQPRRPRSSIMELCWGDVGLLLSMPRQGLGNSAIASVADDEQLERFGGRGRRWRSPSRRRAPTRAAIRTTAVLDGDEYVLNGEKIYVTAGERADLVVVWATLDRAAGPRGDQVVRRRALEPRAEARPAGAQARHPRLRHRGVPARGLPRAEGGPARHARDRRQARASPA